MKVLLDENIPHDLRAYLTTFETYTAAYMGWSGLKNGRLLEAAESAGFDVLVTGDRTLHQEQNMEGRSIALVVLSAIGWPVIQTHAEKIALAVSAASPGSFTRVECGGFNRRKRYGLEPT